MKKNTYNTTIICENCDYPNIIQVARGDFAPDVTNCDNCRCSTRIPIGPIPTADPDLRSEG